MFKLIKSGMICALLVGAAYSMERTSFKDKINFFEQQALQHTRLRVAPKRNFHNSAEKVVDNVSTKPMPTHGAVFTLLTKDKGIQQAPKSTVVIESRCLRPSDFKKQLITEQPPYSGLGEKEKTTSFVKDSPIPLFTPAQSKKVWQALLSSEESGQEKENHLFMPCLLGVPLTLKQSEVIMQEIGFNKHVENLINKQDDGDFTKNCTGHNLLKALEKLGLFENIPEDLIEKFERDEANDSNKPQADKPTKVAQAPRLPVRVVFQGPSKNHVNLMATEAKQKVAQWKLRHAK